MKRIEYIFWGILAFGIIMTGCFLYFFGYIHGHEKHRQLIQQEVEEALIKSRISFFNVMQEVEKAKKEVEKAKEKNEECKNFLNYPIRNCFK